MKTLLNVVLPLGLASAIPVLGATSALAQDVKPGDPAAAKTKIAMCIGCHGIMGYQSSFPEIHRVPMISGQSAKYIEASLQAYKKGDRKHPTMRGIAASLSDQDMADLAAYYEQSGKNLPASKGKTASHAAEAEALLKKGNCASCHGKDGKPVKAGARDFRNGDRMKMYSDSVWFWRISEGVPNTKMKPWKSKLSEEDRWKILAFERSFGLAGKGWDVNKKDWVPADQVK